MTDEDLVQLRAQVLDMARDLDKLIEQNGRLTSGFVRSAELVTKIAAQVLRLAEAGVLVTTALKEIDERVTRLELDPARRTPM